MKLETFIILLLCWFLLQSMTEASELKQKLEEKDDDDYDDDDSDES